MRITDKVAEMVEKALQTHAPDEGVEYEVWVDLMPVGEAVGRAMPMQPMLIMLMRAPSPVLGEQVQTCVVVNTPSMPPGEVEVDQMVTEQLSVLQDKQAEILAQANGKPPPRRATWGDKEGLPWDQAIGEG